MGEDELLAELVRSLEAMDKRHQRISETLEEMLQEVDGLLLRMEKMEEDALLYEEDEWA